jgi:hypothetical protein
MDALYVLNKIDNPLTSACVEALELREKLTMERIRSIWQDNT